MLPLGQLGGRLGRKARGGAKMNKRGAKLVKVVVTSSKKRGQISMEKKFYVKFKEKLPRSHISRVWGRKMNDLA